MTNGPLTALRDGESGGNGVYRYGSASGFPTGSYQSSNYWVDVVFVPGNGAPASATDTTPPVVRITSPSSGSSYTTAQTVTITATASDEVGVTRVELYDGTTLLGTATASPWPWAWPISAASTSTVPHVLTAKAYDGAGNSATSAAVSVTVTIGSSATGQATAAWEDPNNQPGVVGGYELHYGLTSGVATDRNATVIDVGMTLTRTVTGLTRGATYHFAVLAYDVTKQLKSPLSTEVAFTVP